MINFILLPLSMWKFYNIFNYYDNLRIYGKIFMDV